MMSDHQDGQFDSLMQRVENGSDEAIRELLETYGSHILRTIRRRLSRHIRSQFDSGDFYQAVWASFFTNDQMPKFATEEDLVTFLSRVAGNKVINECRKQLQTQKRDLTRERSLFDSATEKVIPVAANCPTPSEVVVAKETVEQLVEGHPTVYRRILQLRTNGSTFEEIAGELGVNEKTVRRVVKRLEARIDL
jgi:RNA polymerase sigma factor (sigma-70 family)